jgi:hypothetical protein|tara:strand:+ start:250 stop:453 length:204 start_codon:yes stop_codon:yes gene_type:complete
MKKYELIISRTYTTTVVLKFPDDGRNHMQIIRDKFQTGNEEIWDVIAEKELEQMDVRTTDWEIAEIN